MCSNALLLTIAFLVVLVAVPFFVDSRHHGWHGGNHRFRQELGGFGGFDFWLNPNVNSMFRQIEKSIRTSSSDRNDHLRTPYSVSRNNTTGLIDIALELPGVPANALVVEIEEEKLLRIKGTRYHGTDREYTFQKVFRMVDELEADSIRVTLHAGILHIQAKPKKKDIRTLKINLVEPDEKDMKLHDGDDEDSNVSYHQKTEIGSPIFDVENEDATTESSSNTVDFEYEEL